MAIEDWGRGYADGSLQTMVNKGLFYGGFVPNPNQTLKVLVYVADRVAVPSPFPWVTSVMPAGGDVWSTNIEDGLDYVLVPVGYKAFILSAQVSHDTKIKGSFYVDGFIVGTAVWESNSFSYDQPLLLVSTELADPTYSSSHVIQIKGTNLENKTSEGSSLATIVLERVVD